MCASHHVGTVHLHRDPGGWRSKLKAFEKNPLAGHQGVRTNWGEKKPGLGLDPPTLHKLANEGSPPLRS